MSNALLISVRFHEGRYHGTGDWPPSPARLFQALIAGAGLQGPLNPTQIKALQWLETMAPPIVAAPVVRKGQLVDSFVPNNDSDSPKVGGDPRRIGLIRAKKAIHPHLFDAEQPFLYAWTLPDEPVTEEYSRVIQELAERLYQLGRGVDLAWTWAESLNELELASRLDAHVGTVYRPSFGGNGKSLSCPAKGSFRSLEDRYVASQSRFEVVRMDRGAVSQNFRRLPKPKFQSVAYDSPPHQRLFDLRSVAEPEQFQVWSLDRVCVLTESIRDAVCERLLSAFPENAAQIEHWIIGRRADGSNGGNPGERVRIIPLASIGHSHADYGVRRVLVLAPTNCPVRTDDLFWAFNGLELGNAGESGRVCSAEDARFLKHYGIGDAATDWQTITPAALPETARRRRIEPGRRLAEAKNASERAREQEQARAAVLTALRHAGLKLNVLEIVVQREPFQSHGSRVGAFAQGTRFPKERLWHVAIKFAEPIQGPLVIGDGRFLGLGVFAPCFWNDYS